MANDKTHWKQFHDYNYLGAYMMPPNGADVILTIKEVKAEQVAGDGGKKDRCMVVYFKEKDTKPMILNVTNSKTIQKLHGSPFVEDWAGKQIQLYVAQVNAFGDVTDALRIRDFISQQKAIDVSNALETLKEQKSFADLQLAYTSLSDAEKKHPDVIALKDELKKKFK